MNDEQLLRYSRHLLLEEIDIAGQEKLLASRILIIGAGGLGSSAGAYLAAAGIGHITLLDHDRVELTNLQRQIMHTQDRIGTSKVESGKLFLSSLNPTIQIKTINTKANLETLDLILKDTNIVLDCTDNFSTRQALNASCIIWKTSD